MTRMQAATITHAVHPHGRIVKLAGYDDFAAMVAEKKEDIGIVVRQIWPEALIRQEFEEMLSIIPDRPVAVGERWTESGTMVLPPIGSFTTVTQKTFAQIDRAGHVHTIGLIAGKYSPPTTPADFFRVAGGDLKMTKATWESTFDRERGRPLRIEKKIELRGQLTLEMSGGRRAGGGGRDEERDDVEALAARAVTGEPSRVSGRIRLPANPAPYGARLADSYLISSFPAAPAPQPPFVTTPGRLVGRRRTRASRTS